MSKRKKYNSNINIFLLLIVFILIIYILSYTTSLSKYININKIQDINIKESTTKIIKTSKSNTINNENNLIKIHYLDVGQGDSIFIELPNNENMLIDASTSNMSYKIESYLKKLGINKINYIIGTHPHEDHIGGLTAIVKDYDFDNIYMPKVVTTTKTYEDLLDAIASKNKKIQEGKKGIEIINTKDLNVYMIAPISSSYDDLNDYSIVLMIRYINKKFLFMGDATSNIEKEITDDVSADVIKVGHHGSTTSSSPAFVVKVKPTYAIVSVGKDNQYNLPNKDIINRWKIIGASVYRTDISGNIDIISDGNNININTENKNE